MDLPKLSLIEWLLIQVMMWAGLWLTHEYLAALLTSIVSVIVFGVLFVALISEKIERSKVPRRFFGILWVTAIAPLLAAAGYWWLNGGLDFLSTGT